MKAEINNIINKAKELSELIRNHKITQDYLKSTSELQMDKNAQNLLENLVFAGEKLNDKLLKGENPSFENTQETDMLRKKLEENELAKKHLLFQKNYLDMINTVLERIKNPIQQSK